MAPCPSSRQLRCSTPNRVHHPIVDPATTQLVSKSVLDFFVAGIWIAVQQNLCGHHHAVGAVRALSGLLVDERSLQRVQLLHGTQCLECAVLIFSPAPQGGPACPCQDSAHDNGASNALPEPAAKHRAI